MTTKIHWADEVWNPVTGCSPVSTGCNNCYAKGMTRRLKAMGQAKYSAGFDEVACHNVSLYEPLKKWSRGKPKRIFTCSMSDLFHPSVPFEFIRRVYLIMTHMAAHFDHTFIVLTKRPYRMAEFMDHLAKVSKEIQPPVPGIWHGVTVENSHFLDRVEVLKRVPSVVRFVSCEPLLEVPPFQLVRDIARPNDNDWFDGIDWLVIGGESGNRARPMPALDDVTAFVWAAKSAGVNVFVKQLGAVWSRFVGSSRPKGDDPDEWPPELRVQHFPNS